jgi:hypothetical protein
MKNNEELQLRDGNDLTINEIKSRLVNMDIDFDPNIKPKSYFVEIYNRATKDPKNLRKISSKLFEDLSSISNNQTSRVRQREVNDFKIQDNYGKISKTSNNSLINDNKEYAESTLNNIISNSRKNLNYINDERVVPTNDVPNQASLTEKNVKEVVIKDDFDEGLKRGKISLNVPNLIKQTSLDYEKLSNRIKNVINISILPKKSQIIFSQKVQPYKHAYVSVIFVMICAFCIVVVFYSYKNKDLIDSLKQLLDKISPSIDTQNFNRVCFGFLLLMLISYGFQCYVINHKIASEVYHSIMNILEDIKNDPKENYLSEEKIISEFSTKYDLHSLTFEQEILPRVKSLVYQERRVKIFQFNELNYWRLRV